MDVAAGGRRAHRQAQEGRGAGESYVLYADVIAAQLEEQYKAWSAPLGGVLGSSVVEIDVDGAVRSTMDASKMFNPGTGTAYKIDFQAMTQTNVRSNRMKIRRAAKKRRRAPAAATTADLDRRAKPPRS